MLTNVLHVATCVRVEQVWQQFHSNYTLSHATNLCKSSLRYLRESFVWSNYHVSTHKAWKEQRYNHLSVAHWNESQGSYLMERGPIKFHYLAGMEYTFGNYQLCLILWYQWGFRLRPEMVKYLWVGDWTTQELNVASTDWCWTVPPSVLRCCPLTRSHRC